MNTRVMVLGVPVDSVTHAEAIARVRELARSGGQHHIMTPNPEMIVQAQTKPVFLSLLQKTSLNIPDGTGLLWAARRCHSALSERVTGVDLVTSLVIEPDLQPVFFLGAAEGVADLAAKRLLALRSGLVVAGTYAGTPNRTDEGEIVRRIQASGARTLFVAYGSPAQDLWIDRNLPQLPSVRIAMGVGGAFDFLAGKRKRAPVFMRRIGLEWVWRLLQEPRRIGRILRAVVVFPVLVLTRRKDRT